MSGIASDPTTNDRHTVSIGILTYKRPDGLRQCLAGVRHALTDPVPDPWSVIEILVIDNDPAGGAAATVDEVNRHSDNDNCRLPGVRYVHEPVPGVATARNRALSEAQGDVLVFIDDDETPNPGWPHGLLAVLDETGAALVGAPVLSEFVDDPPSWVIEGGSFEREMLEHRSRQAWLRSGNLAIDRAQIESLSLRFDPRYAQGEDSAFTRAAVKAGLDLRWSAYGSVTEYVTADRFSYRWRLRREYLSSRTWTRASLDLAPSPVARLGVRGRTLLVSAARTAEGLAGLARSLPTRSKTLELNGLVHLAGAAGKVVEIVAYRRP